jgi:hypothetical protein
MSNDAAPLPQTSKVPAAFAGYHAALGLAQIGVPAEGWRQAFALIGAIVVGGTPGRVWRARSRPVPDGAMPPA